MLATAEKQSRATFDFIDFCAAYCPLLKGVDIIRIGVKLGVLQKYEIFNAPELWYEPCYENKNGELICERWGDVSQWWSSQHEARAVKLIEIYAGSSMGANSMCFACHSLKISNAKGLFTSNWQHAGQHNCGLDRAAALDALSWLQSHGVIVEHQRQQSLYKFLI